MGYRLTISIMASGRSETMKKTLKSIEPLLENVSSELIVTDTGCDKELLSYIKKYTDKIVKFTWCNDFAKARNVGLKQAQGQWFMFIDDDEWFEDVSSLISFFNSPKADEYEQLQYIVRNYSKPDGSRYSDMPVDRGFRVKEGRYFVEPIHEHVNDISGKVKIADVFAHHFGYAYDTKEEMLNHARRNIPLEEKCLKDAPWEGRAYAQLIQEYNALEDYEKALEYAMAGLENADSKDANIRHISGFYVAAVFALQNMGRMDMAVNKAFQGLMYEHITNSAKGYLYMYLNGAYMEMGDLEKALEYGRAYFQVADYLRCNKDIFWSESTVLVGEGYNEETFFKVFYIALESAARLHREDDCLKIMKYADPNHKIKYIDDGAWLTELAKLMVVSEKKEAYKDTLSMFINNKESCE